MLTDPSTRELPRELIDHLCRSSALTAQEATHIVQEVLAYFHETPDAFVRRRHQEMQVAGWPNTRIFAVIRAEMNTTRFASAGLSERQIRRLIYG